MFHVFFASHKHAATRALNRRDERRRENLFAEGGPIPEKFPDSPLGDLVNFDLMTVPPEEWQALLDRPVVRGFDPLTLGRALRAGRF